MKQKREDGTCWVHDLMMALLLLSLLANLAGPGGY
jgi:hypothetical protein